MNSITWHLENKVILVSISEQLTVDEMKRINSEITTMLDKGTAPVHLIYVAGSFKTPTDITQVRQSLTFMQHPNFGWIITIGANRLISFISTIVANLSKINLRSVTDIEEAEATLEEVDATIQFS